MSIKNLRFKNHNMWKIISFHPYHVDEFMLRVQDFGTHYIRLKAMHRNIIQINAILNCFLWILYFHFASELNLNIFSMHGDWKIHMLAWCWLHHSVCLDNYQTRSVACAIHAHIVPLPFPLGATNKINCLCFLCFKGGYLFVILYTFSKRPLLKQYNTYKTQLCVNS